MNLPDYNKYSDRSAQLCDAISKQILLLDGAMGTMIQRYRLNEDDFRGDLFASWDYRLSGCNDILVLTAPEKIKSIHQEYLQAGADIIETNTFNANSISLNDYGLGNYVSEINYNAAKLARQVAEEYSKTHNNKTKWVAGSIGPTSKSLSMTSGIDNEALTWDYLVNAYIEQMTALIDGGVDVLLIETIFDGLNAKAALFAAHKAMEFTGKSLPLMMSVTLTQAGRTLSGQTLDAFVASVSHGNLLSIGLNCGFGANEMIAHIENLQNAPFAISIYPNAGLPNEMGEYTETPEITAKTLTPLIAKGKINIIGGCCGTTPEHITEIARIAHNFPPRTIPIKAKQLILAGLEQTAIPEKHLFVNIGERCNVAGSRKFLRLINEKNIDEAIDIARRQIEAGAQIIDINMDDAMLDSSTEMAMFIDRIGQEVDIAKIPLMIDSSDWDTIVTGLKHTQGRPIVNSISLKEGEHSFIEKATFIKEMGAAVVVMAFDEQGQADTFDRKIEVCSRAYHILTEIVGLNGYDIIFDPNVLAVATGIDAHNSYALDFINAVKWIKENLPGAKVSGGISNLSFSFRGNNYVREAMHSLFLYHACNNGMDMGIVNPASLMSVEEIASDLREAIDDVLLNRRNDATDILVEFAERIKAEGEGLKADTKIDNSVNNISATERIEQMIMRGNSSGIEQYLDEAIAILGSPVKVIDEPLMTGINKVGELFGEGKIFLPQVVKSARAMKHAVAYLTPLIEAEKQSSGASSSGRIVIATVKGDVHDIGKNIVNVIMSCNGYEIVDLGVMVPGEEIISKAIEINADFIALSGLITPSLDEMCHVAQLMEENGLSIPLLIGGATTSELHTAVKIAPCYNGVVVHTRDAAMLPGIVAQLSNLETKEKTIQKIRHNQNILRLQHENKSSALSLSDARNYRFDYGKDTIISEPHNKGINDFDIPVSEARKLINWRAFFGAWKLDASFADIATISSCGHCHAQWLAAIPQEKRLKASEAMQLYKDASHALNFIENNITDSINARVAILSAGSYNEEIHYQHGNETFILPTPRQLHLEGNGERLSLADYIKPISDNRLMTDWIGLFVVTTGMEIQRTIEHYKSIGDDYHSILYQSIADRLAEASTELMHHKVRNELWKFEGKGIRPAIGYPSLPNQKLVFLADKVLHYAQLGITLTENGAMYPLASTTGYIFAHPRARYFSI